LFCQCVHECVDYDDLYISEEDWPRFTWNADSVVSHLSAARYEQGLLLGKMGDLGYQLKNEATLAASTEDTVKSSAIEGEELNPECAFWALRDQAARSSIT